MKKLLEDSYQKLKDFKRENYIRFRWEHRDFKNHFSTEDGNFLKKLSHARKNIPTYAMKKLYQSNERREKEGIKPVDYVLAFPLALGPWGFVGKENQKKTAKLLNLPDNFLTNINTTFGMSLFGYPAYESIRQAATGDDISLWVSAVTAGFLFTANACRFTASQFTKEPQMGWTPAAYGIDKAMTEVGDILDTEKTSVLEQIHHNTKYGLHLVVEDLKDYSDRTSQALNNFNKSIYDGYQLSTEKVNRKIERIK